MDKHIEVGQTQEELAFNLEVIELLQPRTIVEIGSASGGHIYYISRVLKKEHNIISIDPWESTKYRQQYFQYNQLISSLKETYKKINYSHIRGRSQSENTVRGLKKILGKLERKIDFLFIDGSHEKEDVLQDWDNYRGLVGDEGLICFHDVIGERKVADAWKEIVSSLNERYFSVVVNKKGVPLLKNLNKVRELGLGYIYTAGLSERVKIFLSATSN